MKNGNRQLATGNHVLLTQARPQNYIILATKQAEQILDFELSTLIVRFWSPATAPASRATVARE